MEGMHLRHFNMLYVRSKEMIYSVCITFGFSMAAWLVPATPRHFMHRVRDCEWLWAGMWWFGWRLLFCCFFICSSACHPVIDRFKQFIGDSSLKVQPGDFCEFIYWKSSRHTACSRRTYWHLTFESLRKWMIALKCTEWSAAIWLDLDWLLKVGQMNGFSSKGN